MGHEQHPEDGNMQSGSSRGEVLARYRRDRQRDAAYLLRVREVEASIREGGEPDDLITFDQLRAWLNDVRSGRAVRPPRR
jgi:hypothetical protein